MKRVDQTKFGEDGNCFAACIASILECRLEEVPDLMEAHKAGKSYRNILGDWLAQRGLAYIELSLGTANWWMAPTTPPTWHIIGGSSPRGCPFGHAVVGFKGKMVHDPHPDRSGILQAEEWGFFIQTVKQCV